METEKIIQAVAIVAALLQIIKTIPVIDRFKAWFPLASVALGLGLASAMNLPDVIVTGILIGLSASGGYDLFKSKDRGSVKREEATKNG